MTLKMSKNKTFRFTTEITPETEILLSGRNGQPLSMSLDDGRSAKTVRLDTASVIRLQAFLSDYLQDEASSLSTPFCEPTGRALAVMDGDTLDILRVFKTGNAVGFAGAETDSYEELCGKVRSLADIDLPARAVFIFFDTYDGTISRSVLRRILRACISYQVDFVRTGDPSRCRRMILEDIEAFTTIDMSVISRATRDVLVLSPAGSFTMKAADGSLDLPSLFDEGTLTVSGEYCSRKAVLAVIRDLIEGEDKSDPFTDEEMAERLAGMGYVVARRTVAKYRELLGIGKRSERRIRS
jgi:hypothetical protein